MKRRSGLYGHPTPLPLNIMLQGRGTKRLFLEHFPLGVTDRLDAGLLNDLILPITSPSYSASVDPPAVSNLYSVLEVYHP